MQNYNYEEALQKFREKRRYEIHDGKIYFMAVPKRKHSEIVANLMRTFGAYIKGGKCRVYGENMNVIFEKGEKQFLPDIKIVCNPDIIKDDGIYGAPDLIVEILSQRTRKNDLGYKKDVYEKYGVKEYWIIDPNDRSIQVYLLYENKYVLANVYSLYREDELESVLNDMEEFDEEQGKFVKGEIIYEFKTSLYDDLIIKLEDVFENID